MANLTTGAISLQASETVTCTFENTEDDDPNKGRIIVIKETDPDGALMSHLDSLQTITAHFSLI